MIARLVAVLAAFVLVSLPMGGLVDEGPAPSGGRLTPAGDGAFVRVPAVVVHPSVAVLPSSSPSARASRARPLHHVTAWVEPSDTRLDITAYCWTGSRNAAGRWPAPGEVAGNRWPLGTRLRVDGLGTFVVADRIGHGSDVDVYMGRGASCERAARTFGRQHRAVSVVR